MSVWFAIPSKRPPEEARPLLKLWLERGYCVAIQRDATEAIEQGAFGRVDFIGSRPYAGYSESVNWLTKMILDNDPEVEWIVTGGDDVQPDLKHTAEEIAAECNVHFNSLHPQHKTFGVMQPTGDRWGENEPWARSRFPDRPAYIDRICGSPWMGYEFCRRMYGGNGPMWPEYFHMFNDEEMQCVAEKLGILWQRRDLIHQHKHWGRKEGGGAEFGRDCPEFLKYAAGSVNWDRMKKIFDTRKAAGFPGHEPLR